LKLRCQSTKLLLYRGSGEVEEVLYANGIYTDYTYDANRGWLTSVCHWLRSIPCDGSLVDYRAATRFFARDAAGRITGQSGYGSANWQYRFGTSGHGL
jgi:hypothetical protein